MNFHQSAKWLKEMWGLKPRQDRKRLNEIRQLPSVVTLIFLKRRFAYTINTSVKEIPFTLSW